MYIWIFDGTLGAGKTLGMTLFSHYYADRTGATIYSNYNGGHKQIEDYRFLLDVAKQHSSIIQIDEAQVSFDSRFFARKGQVYMTQLLFYLRKLRSTMMLSSPSIANIDSRVRQITNIYVFCENKRGNFNYTLFDFQSGKQLRKYAIPHKKAYDFVSAKYDTSNIVQPFEFPTDDNLFHSFLQEVKETNEQYIHMGRSARLTGRSA
jgi:hypothetical protein